MFLNQYAMTKMKKYEKVYGSHKCVQTVVVKGKIFLTTV